MAIKLTAVCTMAGVIYLVQMSRLLKAFLSKSIELSLIIVSAQLIAYCINKNRISDDGIRWHLKKVVLIL